MTYRLLMLFWLGPMALFAQSTPDSLTATADTLGRVDSVASAMTAPDSLAAERGMQARHDALRLALQMAQRRQDSMALLIQWMDRSRQGLSDLYVFADTCRGQRFFAAVVEPAQQPIQLLNRRGKRKVYDFETVAELAEAKGHRLIFAMNAGMYQPNRQAQGLMIVNGVEQQPIDTATSGYGNFYLQPNGIFALDSSGRGYVVTTQQYPRLADSVGIRYATQSGPMMLVDGQINPLFGVNSPNRHIRNAVGVTRFGQVVFAISERPVTFYELSTFLRRQGCVHALYLDGAISQAYLPQIGVGKLENGRGLGPIVVILE